MGEFIPNFVGILGFPGAGGNLGVLDLEMLEEGNLGYSWKLGIVQEILGILGRNGGFVPDFGIFPWHWGFGSFSQGLGAEIWGNQVGIPWTG